MGIEVASSLRLTLQSSACLQFPAREGKRQKQQEDQEEQIILLCPCLYLLEPQYTYLPLSCNHKNNKKILRGRLQILKEFISPQKSLQPRLLNHCVEFNSVVGKILKPIHCMKKHLNTILYNPVYGLRMPIYGNNLSQYGKIRDRIQAFFAL